MPNVLWTAIPTSLLSVATASVLWNYRYALKPVHIKYLAWTGAVALVLTVLTRDQAILPSLWSILFSWALISLLIAFVFMRIAAARPVRGADKSARMRSGMRDLSRSYAVPQLVALLLAAQFHDTPLASLALATAALLAGLSWIYAARRARSIRNTPTSKIVSAAQGYVELNGRALHLAEKPVRTPLRRVACIWFSYRIEEKRGRSWRVVESGSSEEPFLLDDGSGKCVVQPAHALVHTERKASWREGNRRYFEEWLTAGTRVYALGDFSTENEAAIGRNAQREVGQLLAQWKRDPATLRARFDADRDGEVSLAEWQVAQRAAEAKVDAEHAQIHALPATHFLRAPSGRRDFLISDKHEDDVSSKTRRSAILRMVWFAVLLGAALVAIGRDVMLASQRTASVETRDVAPLRATGLGP